MKILESRTLLWPVPKSPTRTLPQPGAPGSFWENRGDRFHCGVDIYAPFGSEVLAMENGLVVQTQLFTSPHMIGYWNDTYAVTIQHGDLIVRYAEMENVLVHVGSQVKSGTVIGHVGKVLELARITSDSPLYIQKLKQKDNPTMLHVEMFDRFPFDISNYSGGNTFQNQKPEILLDPAVFLLSC